MSAGILPGSGRNVAAYEQTTDPFIVPFITIPPGNTDVSSFDLASFKFGCVSGGDTAKGVSSCVIGVNGYRNSQKVASQSFNYIPGTVTKANMTEAQLNTSFKNLDRVEFATTYDPTVKQNGTTYIDNVKYTAHEGS